jgi:hypothetical protein
MKNSVRVNSVKFNSVRHNLFWLRLVRVVFSEIC